MQRSKLFKSQEVIDINAGKTDRYIDSKGKVIVANALEDSDTYQSLRQLSVGSKLDARMPPVNRQYMRLYGHYMCPFVERVRLALAAKGLRDY